VGWLLVGAGVVGMIFPVIALRQPGWSVVDLLTIVATNLIGLFCGVLLLRRVRWARWLAIAWLGFHVAIGALNSVKSGLVHALFLAICAYALFCREAAEWFRADEGRPTSSA
jgi:hypothetical protein